MESPNVHVVSFDRYWSHTQDFQEIMKFPIRVFLETLISYSRFSKYYDIHTSCSLEDIDIISKIFKNFEDGSSWFSGARLFHQFPSCRFPRYWDFPKVIFSKCFGICFWTIWNHLVGTKLNIFDLGSHGHVGLIRKLWECWLLWVPKVKLEKLLVHSDAE